MKRTSYFKKKTRDGKLQFGNGQCKDSGSYHDDNLSNKLLVGEGLSLNCVSFIKWTIGRFFF